MATVGTLQRGFWMTNREVPSRTEEEYILFFYLGEYVLPNKLISMKVH